MDKDNWKTIEKHFSQLIGLSTEDQKKYLEHLQTSDPGLHSILNDLLSEDQDVHPLFSKSGAEIINTWQDDEIINDRVGIYKIEKHLGQGAMASVYLAKRDDGEFEQWVALKLIKVGLYDDPVIELFKKERQTLASFQHPNIARLYDGGVTKQGGPFFTMEYIKGTPITRYCNEKKLGLIERLDLFLQVCQAVKYAHNKLIAHLDLKPGNILVDNEGQVKVLDFGIAKMIEPLNEKSGIKEYQKMLRFTLAYASPEQIEGREVTSSSDIYSLGILLFEIIVGFHPYQPLFEKPIKLKEAILNGQPAFGSYKKFFPSGIKISGNTYELELIWKTAKSVKPEDRYNTVDSLIQDIEAFKSLRPLSVIKSNGFYTGKKFVQRNSRTVSALTLSILAITFTVIFYTQQVKKQRDIAQAEANKASKVTSFLSDIFKMADPYEVNGDTVTAIQLLENGLQKINTSLKDQPEIKASLFHEITGIYVGLGRYREADSLGKVAIKLTDSLYSGDHPEKARSLREMGSIMLINLQLDSALALFRKSYNIYMNTKIVDPVTTAALLNSIGNVYYEKGEYETADSLFRKVYSIHQEVYETPHEELANDLQLLGAVNRKMGNYETAENYYLQSLEMKEKLFNTPHQEIAYTLNHLSSLKQNQMLFEEAIPFAKASYEQRKLTLGAVHIETIASQSNLARIYGKLNDHSMAIFLYKDALTQLKKIFPEGHMYISAILHNLINLYFQTGELENAEVLAYEAYQLDSELMSGDDVYLSKSLYALGKIYLSEKRDVKKAKKYLEEAYSKRKLHLSEEDILLIESQQAYGECLLVLKEYEKAIAVFNEAYQVLKTEPGKNKELLNDLLHKLELAVELSGNPEHKSKFLLQ